MDESTYAELVKAVRLRSTLLAAKRFHGEETEKIKEARKALLMKAVALVDGSPSMDQINRDIDLLDQQEFELHHKFRKTIQETEHGINRTVLGMVERKFGPNWNSDSVV